MSYSSGFFDSIDLGSGNYDRSYTASQFAHYFSLFIKNGVFANPTRTLQVFASSEPNMEVSIDPGSAWINGYWFTVAENFPEIFTVGTANPTLSRIDSVVIGWSSENRLITPYIKQGSLSSNPVPIELQRDAERYEIELAQITVQAGASSITQSNIKDMRQDSSRCGIVKGTIEEIDTTDLFAQFTDAFNTWFEEVQTQLSGDVAGNLQSQITALKEYSESRPHVSIATALSSGWTSEYPSENTIEIPYVKNDDECDVIVGLNHNIATDEQRETERKAVISPSSQAQGSITLKAYGIKPDKDLPIVAYIFYK